jgi:hypothetical protein
MKADNFLRQLVVRPWWGPNLRLMISAEGGWASLHRNLMIAALSTQPDLDKGMYQYANYLQTEYGVSGRRIRNSHLSIDEILEKGGRKHGSGNLKTDWGRRYAQLAATPVSVTFGDSVSENEHSPRQRAADGDYQPSREAFLFGASQAVTSAVLPAVSDADLEVIAARCQGASWSEAAELCGMTPRDGKRIQDKLRRLGAKLVKLYGETIVKPARAGDTP